METPTTDAPVVEPLPFDLDAVTPRMLIDFKRETGVSLMSLVDGELELDIKTVPEEAIAGIVWLALRMGDDPDVSFEAALDTPFTRVLAAAEVDAEDPTSAG